MAGCRCQPEPRAVARAAPIVTPSAPLLGAVQYYTGRQCIGAACWDSPFDTPEPFLEPVPVPMLPSIAGAPWFVFAAIGVGIAYLYYERVRG